MRLLLQTRGGPSFLDALRPLFCGGSDRMAALQTSEWGVPWPLCFEARGFVWALEGFRRLAMVSGSKKGPVTHLCSRRV